MRDLKKLTKKNCVICNTEFEGYTRSTCCSTKCTSKFSSKIKFEKLYAANKLKYDGADPNSYVTCGICGFVSGSITAHIKSHNISGEDYKNQYGPLASKDWMDNRIGENNISYKGKNKTVKTKPQYDTDDTTDGSYVACGICGFRGKNITNHIKIHDISLADYKKQYGSVMCKDLRDKLTGENNPAYNHGGKFSPFSKNFVKYQDLAEEEKANIIAEKFNDIIKFKEENPQINNTRIEYYLAQGMSEEDAQKALSKRQTTFSLKVCQEKHGEEVGKRIWEERQEKWMKSLNDKTEEEKDEISRKKGINRNCLDLFLAGSTDPASLYLIKISDNQYKIGITTQTLEKRYTGEIYDKYKVIYNETDTISHVFMVEQIIKDNYKRHVRRKEYGDFGEFGWTEVLNDIDLEPLEEKIKLYMNNKELTTNKFSEIYI